MSLDSQISALSTVIVASVRARVKAVKDLAAATETAISHTIVDDGSSTATWPNRWELLYKPVAGSAVLTSWFNEYGELRITPGKTNTVAFRIFGHATSGGTHTGNLLEIQDDRVNRNNKFTVDQAGNTEIAGTAKVSGNTQLLGTVTGATGVAYLPIYVNPGSLTGKPPGLIVRT